MNDRYEGQKPYPPVFELDGTYVRVQRDGKWVSRCFSDLTDKEQENFIATLSSDGVKKLCLHLAACLRHTQEF